MAAEVPVCPAGHAGLLSRTRQRQGNAQGSWHKAHLHADVALHAAGGFSTRQHVHERRFAGARGADQRRQHARPECAAHVLQTGGRLYSVEFSFRMFRPDLCNTRRRSRPMLIVGFATRRNSASGAHVEEVQLRLASCALPLLRRGVPAGQVHTVPDCSTEREAVMCWNILSDARGSCHGQVDTH